MGFPWKGNNAISISIAFCLDVLKLSMETVQVQLIIGTLSRQRARNMVFRGNARASLFISVRYYIV